MAKRLGVTASKPHKYRAKRITVDGVKFDSQREAERAGELLYRVKAGEIVDLRIHHGYEIRVNGVFIGVYEADFVYLVVANGEEVVEDAKGVRTPLYKLKKKLVEAIHGIRIQEV
jgi:hypothetical protein